MVIDSRQTLVPLAGVSSVHYYSLLAAEQQGLAGIGRLPRCLKNILENLIRQHAEGRSDGSDIARLAGWLRSRGVDSGEIAFRPTRMIMPESSGLPLFGDLAAMRDAMAAEGGNPAEINPQLPVDVIVDHSGDVEVHGRPDAVELNLKREVERNGERYRFLRWASQAFERLRVFPPGAGICHQINLEYLARVVWTEVHDGRTIAFPDSLIGMDSHTSMINSLGIIGWGVGGLEGGSVALGEPVSLLIPPVIGIRLSGRLPAGANATDLVLTITERLRREKLVGKFIEYFGEGLSALALPDRATVANMTPEIGPTMSFFPVDQQTLTFLRLTGRSAEQIALVEAYARAQGLWWEPGAAEADYTEVIDIDLSAVESSMAGPSRPQDRVTLTKVQGAFTAAFPPRPLSEPAAETKVPRPRDGDIVLAAITSCTNTSNPWVMLGAGLLARNAVRRGLRTQPWVKTSLAPGSRVVAGYLRDAGLQEPLDALGFNLVGFGCMTCMGNSGPLVPGVAESIEKHGSTTVAVISGNRNFEGRVHVAVRANFLASPPLVVAYALAGRILINMEDESLGTGSDGRPVFLADIWPSDTEIQDLMQHLLAPARYTANYENILEGSAAWRAISGSKGTQMSWDEASKFIRRPPFFEGFQRLAEPSKDIRGARVLALLGDMVTTDHISPIGVISPGTPADQYLQAEGVPRADYVNYAARRLNHDVMIRGTFANIRLRNEMTPEVEGSSTVHYPSGEHLSIPDAAGRYRASGVALVIVAGLEYGAGSSRDWAAKGTRLLGVGAVIAGSFERIHRSNLVGMGVLPLEFTGGDTRKSLSIDGGETFDILGLSGDLKPGQEVRAMMHKDGKVQELLLKLRLDTQLDLSYFRHGGMLPYVLRRYLNRGKNHDTTPTPA